MPIRIEFLSEATHAAARDFIDQVWDRPRSDAYFRWRYIDAPNQKTVIVHRDGACLAMVSAFVRPYRFGAEIVDCVEPFDWICLPELRHLGYGVRVFKHLMDMGMPMITLGGSEDTRSILPRLGFKTVSHGETYLIPFSGRSLEEGLADDNLKRRSLSAAFDVLGRFWFRRGSVSGRKLENLIPVASLGDDIANLPDTHGLEAVPELRFLNWLMSGFPPAGTFIPLRFTADNDPAAWALARVYRQGGRLRGALVHFQPGNLTVQDVARGVRTVVAALSEFGVDSIWTTVTSPILKTALRRNRFLRWGDAPALVWPAGRDLPAGPAHLTLLRGDGGFVELPTNAEYERYHGAPAP